MSRRLFPQAAIAHRGLHGDGAPENTLTAFRRAAEAGYAIELDVRRTKDGCAIVLHDPDLSRTFGVDRPVRAMLLDEIRACRPADMDGAPTLGEALGAVGGRVPILLEVKHGRRDFALCAAVAAAVRAYPGEVWIESFFPHIVAWFRFRLSGVPRGQLLGHSVERLSRFRLLRPLIRLALKNPLTRADFAAVTPPLRNLVREMQLPAAVWTVTDPGQFESLWSEGFSPIFEGFSPAVPSRKKPTASAPA